VTRVSRSLLLVLGLSLVAMPLMALGIDMIFTHRLYPVPETSENAVEVTTEDGQTLTSIDEVYTPWGAAQRRRDLAWGSALITIGLGSWVWGLWNLIKPRQFLEYGADGLVFYHEGRGQAPLSLGWDEIAEVASGVRTDDGGRVPVLSLKLRDPGRLPVNPLAAVVEPPWLHLVAEEWDRPAKKVAEALEEYRVSWTDAELRE
jgi:hypothetical protein